MHHMEEDAEQVGDVSTPAPQMIKPQVLCILPLTSK